MANPPKRTPISSTLQDSEERARQLASIVESSDDSIVGTDLKRRITTWNRGAERLFGYTAAEAVGMPIGAIVPEDRHDEELAIFERFQRGERIEPFDTIRRHKSGRLIDVSLSISPIRNLTGQIVGACSVTRDITPRC
jgi:PAS domain S-box-containing protein